MTRNKWFLAAVVACFGFLGAGCRERSVNEPATGGSGYQQEERRLEEGQFDEREGVIDERDNVVDEQIEENIDREPAR